MSDLRIDHEQIVQMVHTKASVLDLGCGEGDLLALLQKRLHVKGQGIEIDEQAVYACVAAGVSVLQGDIDTELTEYNDSAFDYVILNQCLQQVSKPGRVLDEALRVGKKVIIGFPNFAHINARMQMFFGGKAPMTLSLPFEWHNSPNSHFLSIRDFDLYCHQKRYCVQEKVVISNHGRVRLFQNIFGEVAIYVIGQSPHKARESS